MNVPYNVALAVSGGTPGYTWSLASDSPQAPAGLTLNSNGIISGTPTGIGGPVDLVIRVQDSTEGGSQAITKSLAISTRTAPSSLTIVTSSLPPGTINQPYATALGGNGGTTPYTWGLKPGSAPLPNGLTLSPSTGAIVGTPTVVSSETHTFTLTDATSLTIERGLQLSISAVSLQISTDSLPRGTAGQNYSAQLVAIGGTGGYTWGLSNSSPPLPSGLSLNTSSGLISGTPSTASDQTLVVTVTDQTLPTPQSVTKNLQLLIEGAVSAPVINPFALPAGTVNRAYPNIQLAATGGTGPYTWSVNPALPNGLTLNPSSGVISGIPLSGSNGTTTHTFTVRDSSSPVQQTSSSAPTQLTINAM
ncbi:hypothetical protein W02_27330 [Nitrospira sp. KM1]|nr:hypothetical protein W02_27330 [Nitrospira sp. KM1]